MNLPSLQPVISADIYISGDVRIHESAIIGSGAILQADPGCRIIVSAGACIGMGAVIHAHQGNIEIRTGVNLGAGALVVGDCVIGDNACVGAVTTLFNTSIPASQLVSPGTFLGNAGRPLRNQPPASPQERVVEEPVPPAVEAAEHSSPEPESPEPQPTPESSALVKPGENDALPKIPGQEQLDRLLGKLFPYNQSMNPPADPWT